MDDISHFAVSETAEIDLFKPNGDPLHSSSGERMSVTVYGPGSKKFASAQHRASNRSLMRAKKNQKLSAEERLKEIAEFLAEVTVSFNHFSYRGVSDASAIRACYEDAAMGWLTGQVDQKAGDWANFYQEASSN